MGLSDWRKARPYSRASRNVASSEMEPVRAWSQLLGEVSASDLRLSSATVCSRSTKRFSMVAWSSIMSPLGLQMFGSQSLYGKRSQLDHRSLNAHLDRFTPAQAIALFSLALVTILNIFSSLCLLRLTRDEAIFYN